MLLSLGKKVRITHSRLLAGSLRQLAVMHRCNPAVQEFPVDTNVGRISARRAQLRDLSPDFACAL